MLEKLGKMSDGNSCQGSEYFGEEWGVIVVVPDKSFHCRKHQLARIELWAVSR